MSTVRDAVLLAAETLEEHPDRWLQGDLFEFDENHLAGGPVRACAIGTCRLAAGVLGVPLHKVDDAVTGASLDAYGEGLDEFNDHVARTPAEVVVRLRELAERL